MRGSVRCAVCRAGSTSVAAQTAGLSEDVAPPSGFYRGSGTLTSHRLFDGSQRQLDSIAGGKIRRTHCCGRAE
jgi:hypothetical protein